MLIPSQRDSSMEAPAVAAARVVKAARTLNVPPSAPNDDPCAEVCARCDRRADWHSETDMACPDDDAPHPDSLAAAVADLRARREARGDSDPTNRLVANVNRLIEAGVEPIVEQPAPRFAVRAVHSTYLGEVFRVFDRERGEYVQTMPRRFVARASAEAAAANLNETL